MNQIDYLSQCSPEIKEPCTLCNKNMDLETVYFLPCNHFFHKKCIFELILKQNQLNHTCPTCGSQFRFFKVRSFTPQIEKEKENCSYSGCILS